MDGAKDRKRIEEVVSGTKIKKEESRKAEMVEQQEDVISGWRGAMHP